MFLLFYTSISKKYTSKLIFSPLYGNLIVISGYTYTFPALRGIQAGREYYVAMCPLQLLPRIFLFDESPLPADLREQRTLNIARIPEISRYLTENQGDYALSAITACIDGTVTFESASEIDGFSDVGRIVIPMTARFVINDGQHRRAAIEMALEEEPSMGDETIAVVFFPDEGLRRSQQLFADLNKHAVKPTKSLNILYDHRDPLSGLCRTLIKEVPYFHNDLVEYEKTTISNRSLKLFTLSSIYQATESLLFNGGKKSDLLEVGQEDLAIKFWFELGKVIPEWMLVTERKVATVELRENYVHSHSVGLHAIGLAGYSLVNQFPTDWTKRLKRLSKIDWSRRNVEVWEKRAMVDGQMSKSRRNVQRTAVYIKEQLGVELTASEIEKELEAQAIQAASNSK